MERRCECGITVDGDLSCEPINMGACGEGTITSLSNARLGAPLRVALMIKASAATFVTVPLSVRVQETGLL